MDIQSNTSNFMPLVVAILTFGLVFIYSAMNKKRQKTNSDIDSKRLSWIDTALGERLIIAGKKSQGILLLGFIACMMLAFGVVFSCLFFLYGGDEALIIGGSILGVAIVLGATYIPLSKCEIYVTTHRIYGATKLGNRVDLPMDSVTAVGTSAFHGIEVSTPSGCIKFKFIENNAIIQSEISKLLTKRQINSSATANKNVANTFSGNADEIKKYKELLDAGIITQEEFDAKKKQLLDL